MTKPNRRFPLLLALVTSLGASLATTNASAEISLTVQPGLPQSLGGDTPYFRNTVTIKDGGVLSVIPVGTPGGTGRLHIKANRIIIEANAVLDATGAGFRGKSGAAGDGTGGGGFLMAAAGGGGAYFGNGGAATNAACGGGFGIGGTKYGDVMTFGLGSAGGAGGTSPGPIGAAGGGSIILEAAQIEINGELNASGNAGISLGGVGSGGGAGGEIRLIAHTFLWGTKASIAASGGVGGKAINSSGGSGGGGLVYVRGAPAPDPAVLDVKGGASAEACAGGQGAGQDGTIDQDPMQVCPDLDGDGSLASLCAGNMTDCDDADPLINPSAPELCDGVDNNCNAQIDEGQTNCAAGLACVNAKCVGENVPDAGPDDAGASPPQTVGYRGGCVMASSASPAPREGAWFAGLALAAALGVRRARRKS